jgi:hypothetical protein
MTKIYSITQLRNDIFNIFDAIIYNKEITEIMLHGKVVAEIRPKKNVKKNSVDFVDLIKSFPKTKSMTVREMDAAYRKAMMKKHGRHISGR